MKIAVPTSGSIVDDHFGHCEFYTIFEINKDNKIENEESIPSPQSCGCKSNIITLLKQKGVTTMLAGNMGQGAVNKIRSAGIELYRGCTGDARKLVEAFLQNEIIDTGQVCEGIHHQHGHGRQCHEIK